LTLSDEQLASSNPSADRRNVAQRGT